MMKRAALVAGTLLALSSCGADGAGTPKVTASLNDAYVVALAPSTEKAGTLRMTAKNTGSMEHEVVIVKMALKDLPTKADGSVDEDAIAESAKKGEIEHVKSRSQKDGTFMLTPGTYAVFCNLSTTLGDGSTVLHYPKGMKAELVVA